MLTSTTNRDATPCAERQNRRRKRPDKWTREPTPRRANVCRTRGDAEVQSTEDLCPASSRISTMNRVSSVAVTTGAAIQPDSVTSLVLGFSFAMWFMTQLCRAPGVTA